MLIPHPCDKMAEAGADPPFLSKDIPGVYFAINGEPDEEFYLHRNMPFPEIFSPAIGWERPF
jgi:hypothetical protein